MKCLTVTDSVTGFCYLNIEYESSYLGRNAKCTKVTQCKRDKLNDDF